MTWNIKRMGDTRREREGKVLRTFGPLYKLANDMRADAVDAVKGRPVLPAWGVYMDAADTLEAWADCFERLKTDTLPAIRAIAKRLRHSVPVERHEVDNLILELRRCEAVYRVTPLDNLRSAINTQMIAFEFERLAGK
jgi:hypothetical protein